MTKVTAWCVALVLAVASALAVAQSRSLRSPSEFSSIADERARSQALFVEAGKVIQDPRCLNCHPVQRRPTQGADLHPHVPPIFTGASGHGVPGLPCSTCHGKANVATLLKGIASIPGNPRWSLAPASMAWQGEPLSQICEQIKDRARNGGPCLVPHHQELYAGPLLASRVESHRPRA